MIFYLFCDHLNEFQKNIIQATHKWILVKVMFNNLLWFIMVWCWWFFLIHDHGIFFLHHASPTLVRPVQSRTGFVTSYRPNRHCSTAHPIWKLNRIIHVFGWRVGPSGPVYSETLRVSTWALHQWPTTKVSLVRDLKSVRKNKIR